MKRLFFVLFLLCIFDFLYGKELMFAFVIPENHPIFKEMESFVREQSFFLDDVDLIKIKYFPNERARQLLIKGDIDGDLGRVKKVYEGIDEVVIVDVPLKGIKQYCVAKEDFYFNGIESLKNKKAVIEMGNFSMISFALKHGLMYYLVAKPSQALNMVNAGRADFFISLSETALPLLENEFKDSGLKLFEPAINEIWIYLFLNKKHEDLVPSFEKLFFKILDDEENNSMK